MGEREAGEGHVADRLPEHRRADLLVDLGALGLRAAVAPEDRAADRLAVGPDGHFRVHHPVHADRVGGAEIGQDRLDGADPILGLVLGPVPLRVKRVALPGGLEDLPVGERNQDALAPRRADVDADRFILT
jgi:hypothetical protein